MDKKKKILAFLAICMASVLLFCFCSFADIASGFVSDPNFSYKLVASDGLSVYLSGCPDEFLLDTPLGTGSANLTYSVTVFNDNPLAETLYFTIRLKDDRPSDPYSYGAGSLKADIYARVDGVEYYCDQSSSFVLDSGESAVLTFNARNPSGWSYRQGLCFYFTSIVPDPQEIPDPVEVLLSSVGDFVDSFFTQASAIVTLIVSSWVFLVPVTMMLVVFFVMAIRKIVKGV